MPVTKAQILVPNVIVQDADPDADEEALERLAILMLPFAPIVAADAPNGIVIYSTGADNLHGGEEAMLEGLLDGARYGSELAATGRGAGAQAAQRSLSGIRRLGARRSWHTVARLRAIVAHQRRSAGPV